MDSNGRIFTTHHVDVYRVFKGEVGFSMDVVSEGGVSGNIMLLVTPKCST